MSALEQCLATGFPRVLWLVIVFCTPGKTNSPCPTPSAHTADTRINWKKFLSFGSIWQPLQAYVVSSLKSSDSKVSRRLGYLRFFLNPVFCLICVSLSTVSYRANLKKPQTCHLPRRGILNWKHILSVLWLWWIMELRADKCARFHYIVLFKLKLDENQCQCPCPCKKKGNASPRSMKVVNTSK